MLAKFQSMHVYYPWISYWPKFSKSIAKSVKWFSKKYTNSFEWRACGQGSRFKSQCSVTRDDNKSIFNGYFSACIILGHTLILKQDQGKKVMLGTKFKRCVHYHELRATDCCFLGGFVQSNLSKPCAIRSILFLAAFFCHNNNTSFQFPCFF